MLNKYYWIKSILPEAFKKYKLEISILSEQRNSTIFLLKLNNKKKYVLKRYKYDSYNTRNRLKSEVDAISFFKEIELKNIPKIFYYDEKFSYILMNYIHGRKIKKIKKIHIKKAISFLKRINENRHKAKSLMNASESCFNLSCLFNIINYRYNLLNSSGIDLCNIGLSDILKEIIALYNNLKRHLEHEYGSLYKDILLKETEKEKRILSPSDFGLHNALERRREVIFLDFEYFGWDDIAKLTGDFLFHPGMDLNFDLKKYFLKKILDIFDFVPHLEKRIKIFYPFLGINWTLRLLNEFLPYKIQKIEKDLAVQRKIQKTQFQKARLYIDRIKEEWDFPYI